jgi:hypothetical protein
MEAFPPDAPILKKPLPGKPASIRYLGFECTSEGRAYSLRVDDGGEVRLFTVTIETAAFDGRKARFQDAPELCFARLQKELLANPELPGGLSFAITVGELDEYRDAQLRRSPDRKQRTARTWP